jgi:prepilin-type processing-associated H-X9-DG protein
LFNSQIIAILAAILFPVFAQAREKARQTSCLSNVKQISLAVMMYAQDYDETLPWHYRNTTIPGAVLYPGGGTSSGIIWPLPVYPYVKNMQIFNCPSWSYKWNGNYTGKQAYGISNYIVGKMLADIKQPAETIMLADAYGEGRDVQCYYITRSIGFSSYDNGILTVIPDRHNGGANFGLCDGHAKWYQVDYQGNIARGYQEFPGLRWAP